MSSILPSYLKCSTAFVVTPACIVTKSTPSLTCRRNALNISSVVISSTDEHVLAAWYIGTVPMGASISFSNRRLTLSISSPVERSITVSAPYCTAVRALFISSCTSACACEVPKLALTFVDIHSPTAIGRMCSRITFLGITALPCAISLISLTGSSPSAAAAVFIAGVICPCLAYSIIVLDIIKVYTLLLQDKSLVN